MLTWTDITEKHTYLYSIIDFRIRLPILPYNISCYNRSSALPCYFTAKKRTLHLNGRMELRTFNYDFLRIVLWSVNTEGQVAFSMDHQGSHGYVWCIRKRIFLPYSHIRARLRLNCDGTRAETRFRLSAKRTSPFKSAGASVHSTTGSRGVRISGSNARYTMFRGSVRVLATQSIRQFPLLFPSCASPCSITFQLDSTSHCSGERALDAGAVQACRNLVENTLTTKHPTNELNKWNSFFCRESYRLMSDALMDSGIQDWFRIS